MAPISVFILCRGAQLPDGGRTVAFGASLDVAMLGFLLSEFGLQEERLPSADPLTLSQARPYLDTPR